MNNACEHTNCTCWDLPSKDRPYHGFSTEIPPTHQGVLENFPPLPPIAVVCQEHVLLVDQEYHYFQQSLFGLSDMGVQILGLFNDNTWILVC